MISRLYIKNYLIIKEAEIDFSKGLNIITGETGAGKSIILDALSLILGERADFSLIRKNADKLIVEGHFDFKGNKNVGKFLKEKDPGQENNYIIIRRELLSKGISRNFLNDSPISLSELKAFGDEIIDIHSQNEHQSLLNKDTHLVILDNFISDKKLKSSYQKKYSELKNLAKEYNDLITKKNSLLEKKNFIEFQLKEINNVNPQEGEEGKLGNELNKLENTEDISNAVNVSLGLLYEDEGGAVSNLSLALKELKTAARYDSTFEKLIQELEGAYISIKDASDTLSHYRGGLNFDPGRIEQIRDRLGSISFLKKKYNLTGDELIVRARELNEELELAENFDFKVDEYKSKIDKLRGDVYEDAVNISAKRKHGAKELQKSVNSYLKEVGLESAQFKTAFQTLKGTGDEVFDFNDREFTTHISRTGIDDVEFLIKTNKGGDFTQLKKTASGGEISRVMLSIKASLSGKDDIPILVFDEIDAGISGRVAGKVGKVLKELSKSHQIISITHLPQIAALSERHFYIEKIESKDDTTTNIKVLEYDEKVNEIAKLISGEKITEASAKSAKELIG